MNKFKKTGLLILLASGMSFAAGSLWTASAPYGIVHFPWVIDCLDDESIFDDQDPDNVCYKTLGGWWYGYVAGKAPGVVGEDINNCKGPHTDPVATSATNYVKAKIGGELVSFVGTDYSSCEGPDVTDRSNGETRLDGALELELNIGPGLPAPDYEPSIAAIGVNLSTDPDDFRDPPPIERNMASLGFNGFCITYESDHVNVDKDNNLAFELGWDELSGDKGRWDTWYVLIPDGPGIQVANFKWAATSTNGTSGDFIQDGYTATDNDYRDITYATGKMKAVKIRLKGYEPAHANFKLIQFGKADECTAEMPTPTTSKKVIANNLNLNLYNKMLSMNVKSPASVQIFNLQGAVVLNQVYVPGSKMNLNNLPTGVYMVRIPSLGYSGKIMLK